MIYILKLRNKSEIAVHAVCKTLQSNQSLKLTFSQGKVKQPKKM